MRSGLMYGVSRVWRCGQLEPRRRKAVWLMTVHGMNGGR